MNNIAIVAVGYNRPSSMERLLKSIEKIEGTKSADLIISIDKGQRQQEIIEIARQFEWPYGEKIIRAFEKRQGLRNHIIQCGDLTNNYEAVVILEDDLIVSPYFLSYVEQSIAFYRKDERIAGISLYKHLFHPGVSRPFEPSNNGYDAYLMKFAQSWGQCWTREMWTKFKEWYLEHSEMDLSDGHLLPDYIASWNEHSWLKYYMRYLAETNRYYVYPTVSLSSNCSDAGVHCSVPNNDYQVPMLLGNRTFTFPDFDHAIRYDVFLEREGIEDLVLPEIEGSKLMDLYGTRSEYADSKILVSTKQLPYRVIKELSVTRRPIEENIIHPIPGNGIYIYDLEQTSSVPKSNDNLLTRFDVRGVHWKRLLRLGYSGLKDAVKSRL